MPLKGSVAFLQHLLNVSVQFILTEAAGYYSDSCAQWKTHKT